MKVTLGWYFYSNGMDPDICLSPFYFIAPLVIVFNRQLKRGSEEDGGNVAPLIPNGLKSHQSLIRCFVSLAMSLQRRQLGGIIFGFKTFEGKREMVGAVMPESLGAVQGSGDKTNDGRRNSIGNLAAVQKQGAVWLQKRQALQYQRNVGLFKEVLVLVQGVRPQFGRYLQGLLANDSTVGRQVVNWLGECFDRLWVGFVPLSVVMLMFDTYLLSDSELLISLGAAYLLVIEKDLVACLDQTDMNSQEGALHVHIEGYSHTPLCSLLCANKQSFTAQELRTLMDQHFLRDYQSNFHVMNLDFKQFIDHS